MVDYLKLTNLDGVNPDIEGDGGDLDVVETGDLTMELNWVGGVAG